MIVLVDSNVIIDVLNTDERWHDWSIRLLDELGERNDELVINPVVLAEVASNFASLDEALALLDRLDIEVILLDEESAFAAGQAFRRYRREQRDREAILADFLIGAHALHLGGALLTRDVGLYRRYLPDLPLITPETHP